MHRVRMMSMACRASHDRPDDGVRHEQQRGGGEQCGGPVADAVGDEVDGLFHSEVPFVVGTVQGLLAIQPIRMAAHRRITAEMSITLLLSWRRIGPDVRRGGG